MQASDGPPSGKVHVAKRKKTEETTSTIKHRDADHRRKEDLRRRRRSLSKLRESLQKDQRLKTVQKAPRRPANTMRREESPQYRQHQKNKTKDMSGRMEVTQELHQPGSRVAPKKNTSAPCETKSLDVVALALFTGPQP